MGVILPSERYKEVYSNGAYEIPEGIALYDDTIVISATRTKVHRAKGKHETKRNDRELYETVDKE